MRIIAGNDAGMQNGEIQRPARTFSPLNLWDLRLKAGANLMLPAVDGWNTALAVLKGAVLVNGQERAGEATLLLLSGEPIDELIVGYDPFVMNREEEIHQAIADFNSGRFATIVS